MRHLGLIISCIGLFSLFRCFFFKHTATTEIYTLSLHDALPICSPWLPTSAHAWGSATCPRTGAWFPSSRPRKTRWCRRGRSEEHTSELQSRGHLVCRLLLEKKKKEIIYKQEYVNLTSWLDA